MLQIKKLRALGYEVDDARTIVHFSKSELGSEYCLLLAKYRERYEAHIAENAKELESLMEKIQQYPQPERYKVVDVKVLHRSRLEYRITEAVEWITLGI